MSIAELPSPNFNDRNAPIDILLLHYTGMQTAKAAIDRLCDPGAQVSAHYVVDEDGTTYRLVDEENRAWHAGRSAWRGREACNDYSIGIECEGADDVPYEPAQYQTLREVLAVLLEAYPRITRERVVGHSDVAPGRKTDPGPSFDWSQVR